MKLNLNPSYHNQNFKALITKNEDKFSPDQEVLYKKIKQTLLYKDTPWVSNFDGRGYHFEIKPVCTNALKVSIIPKNNQTATSYIYHLIVL